MLWQPTATSKDIRTSHHSWHNFDANVINTSSACQIFKLNSKDLLESGVRQVRYSGGILQGNIDGDLSAEFEIGLTGAPPLLASDIIL
ncbi:hypothetical protein [Nostoc sp. 'Lobaria pulmonaria (5183) cyanobiont']|uniref:hypothetical protein n=1 Tax=Nostoc sp. 'Lobaria pulmonaria (5183) cyanobiont' TaxID=1618022 RepID=UPI000CF33498|nr:hypothetical protein [Nostoc sp. 'Lobaria pulmonaria (5183) cyanobiont']